MQTKDKYTLGLCTMGNSSAALFKNGFLIAAVEEERLSRKKNDGRFPHLAISEVLNIENIKLLDVNEIAVYWQPWRLLTRGLGTFNKLLISSISRKSILKRVKNLFSPSRSTQNGSWLDLFFIRSVLKKKHGFFKADIVFIDHHLTHQKYGEAIENWDNCISLSYDGGG